MFGKSSEEAFIPITTSFSILKWVWPARITAYYIGYSPDILYCMLILVQGISCGKNRKNVSQIKFW